MWTRSVLAPADSRANAASASQLVPGARKIKAFGEGMGKNPKYRGFILDLGHDATDSCIDTGVLGAVKPSPEKRGDPTYRDGLFSGALGIFPPLLPRSVDSPPGGAIIPLVAQSKG